jgi:hypothetical protein
MMEEELKIGRETIHKILLKDPRQHMTCARFVLHCLTNEQKALRLQELIQSVDDDNSLPDSITTDDTGVSNMIPE